MGWKFYRIWSTDWFRNNQIEKERLLNAVNIALKETIKQPNTQSILQNHNQDIKPFEQYEEKIVNIKSDFPEYKTANITSLIQKYNGKLSTHWSNYEVFQQFIKEILEVEAPMSEDFLLSRIVDLFDRQKVTKKVHDDFRYLMGNCHRVGIIKKDGYLYLNKNKELKLRVPGYKRDIKDISIEELSSGMYELIKQNITVEKNNLYRTLSNKCGFDRVRKTISDRFDIVLESLSELVVIDNDTISIKDK